MIGYSTNTPLKTVPSKGKYQVRYNVTDHQRDDMGETITEKKWNYVIVDELTRKKIIDALIRAKYDVNDEFSLVAKPDTDADYIAYRAYVENCKAIADDILAVVTDANTKAEIKAYMDAYGIAYNSGDTKDDLLVKIANA